MHPLNTKPPATAWPHAFRVTGWLNDSTGEWKHPLHGKIQKQPSAIWDSIPLKGPEKKGLPTQSDAIKHLLGNGTEYIPPNTLKQQARLILPLFGKELSNEEYRTCLKEDPVAAALGDPDRFTEEDIIEHFREIAICLNCLPPERMTPKVIDRFLNKCTTNDSSLNYVAECFFHFFHKTLDNSQKQHCVTQHPGRVIRHAPHWLGNQELTQQINMLDITLEPGVVKKIHKNNEGFLERILPLLDQIETPVRSKLESLVAENI